MALRIGWALENATDWQKRTPPGLGNQGQCWVAHPTLSES